MTRVGVQALACRGSKDAPVEPFHHISVMPEEVVEALAPWRGGLFVDGTLGGGGHARLLLEAARARGVEVKLLGLDRDPAALAAAAARLQGFEGCFELVQANYGDLVDVLRARKLGGVDGLLVDAGVSSHQLDTPGRGFSFSQDGPLDMRMGDEGPTAGEWLDAHSDEAVGKVLAEYGEIKGGYRLARKIKDARRMGQLETTAQLAALCGAPSPKDRVHPATQVFQALRIAVNDELGGLERLVGSLGEVLNPGGVCAFISFHSLEDRIVKHGLRLLERGASVSAWDAGVVPFVPVLEVLGDMRRPTEAETERNPRARSARLRVARRVMTTASKVQR